MTLAPERPAVRPAGTTGPHATGPARRARLFLLLTFVVVILFVGRLVQIQGLDSGQLAEEALGNRLVTTTLHAERGQIVDAHGVVLAGTVERRNITVDQNLVPEYTGGGVEGAAHNISAITGQPVEEVQANLTGTRVFAYVAKNVTPEQWRAIQALRVPGVYSEPNMVRDYPAGPVAGNLLGFTGADGAGQAGLELRLQDTLSGTDGERMYERGRSGAMIPTGENNEVAAVNGRSVRLTIDRDLQWYAQQAIADKVAESGGEWGSVIVMDVRTGDVLALAEAPSVNPSVPGDSKAEDRGSRALSDVIEPGSTAKVITAAAVLEEGKVAPTTTFDIPDRYTTKNGQTFKDSHDHDVEQLTFAGVLAQSSNTGTVMAGERLTKQQRYDYMRRFGLGQPTGLGFPAEAKGILNTPDKWDGRQQYTVLFGQGVSLNTLQAADVFAIIANDGIRVQPRLVSAVQDEHGRWQDVEPSPSTRVVSTGTAEAVQVMLESAVEDGTGGNAQIPGYRIAGKTGTAQAPDDRGGYTGYTASFIGMAPAGDPQLVVAVTVQRPTNGYYGGTVAAPVFKDVMSYALQAERIPPSAEPADPYPLYWGATAAAKAAEAAARQP